MASYPDGTVINSPQTFPPNSEFGDGCVFAAGCVFQNPCTFGDGCVFGKGCQLIVTDYRKPPHKTGAACVFDSGCSILYSNVGNDNVISNPGAYAPVSQGSGVQVGSGPGTVWPSGSITIDGPSPDGFIISGDKISNDWCDASNPKGFDVTPGTTVRKGCKN